MRVLLAEDDLIIRMDLAEHLAVAGFDVSEASNGTDACVLAGRPDPMDLLVTDLHMPNMDGLALIHAVRANKSLPPMKILMVTSDGVLDVIQQAMDAGADDVLMKPFSNNVFVERVQGLVGGS